MSQSLPLRRDKARRGGFTLLEVVIALAIFVFGALAIVRIFPPALGVIQNSGDRLVAVNVNRTTLNRYARNTSSVPYATYGIGADLGDADNDGNTTEPFPLPIGTIGSARRNNALPTGFSPNEFQNSALAQFKNISGEKQTVRSFGTNQFYVLTTFPFAGTPAVFREGTLDDVQTRSVGLNSGLLDWNPTPGVAYFASYRFLENGILEGTNDEAINVTSAPIAPVKYQLLQGRRLSGAATDKVIDGPIRMRYRAPITAPAGATNGNLGLIELTGVNAGDQVSIDYTVSDWRQLVNDNLPTVNPDVVPPPAAGDPAARTGREVVLPVRRLSEGSVYSLMAFLDPADTATPRTQVALQTATWTPANASTDTTTLWGVDRKTGRVLFDVNTHVANPTIRNLTQTRVVYGTQDGWTHQVSVAPAQYTPYYTGFSGTASNNAATMFDNPAQPWRYYVWDASNTAGSIYFPPSEAGKTILLSYIYDDGARKELRDEPVTIRERLENVPAALTAAVPFAISGQAAVAIPKQANGGAAFPIISIRSIKGASVQARTAWLDGDHYTQVSTVTLRGADG